MGAHAETLDWCPEPGLYFRIFFDFFLLLLGGNWVVVAQAIEQGAGSVQGFQEGAAHACSPAAMAAQASAVRRSLAAGTGDQLGIARTGHAQGLGGALVGKAHGGLPSAPVGYGHSSTNDQPDNMPMCTRPRDCRCCTVGASAGSSMAACASARVGPSWPPKSGSTSAKKTMSPKCPATLAPRA